MVEIVFESIKKLDIVVFKNDFQNQKEKSFNDFSTNLPKSNLFDYNLSSMQGSSANCFWLIISLITDLSF